MFYYIIHMLPWGIHLTQGKRNVRTFLFGSVLYILLHAFLYADSMNNTLFFILRRYFWYIFVADFIAVAILYKLFFGESIMHEIPFIGEFYKGYNSLQPKQPPQPLLQPSQPPQQPIQPLQQPSQPQQPLQQPQQPIQIHPQLPAILPTNVAHPQANENVPNVPVNKSIVQQPNENFNGTKATKIADTDTGYVPDTSGSEASISDVSDSDNDNSDNESQSSQNNSIHSVRIENENENEN